MADKFRSPQVIVTPGRKFAGLQISHTKETLRARTTKQENGCWIWDGQWSSATGYGNVGYNRKVMGAHRLSYMLFVGPIPHGLVIDHLCGNKKCINPEHLEAVTPRENTMRCKHSPAAMNAGKAHCKHGHQFSGDNLAYGCSGRRVCRTCNRIKTAACRLRKQAGSPIIKPTNLILPTSH